MIGRLVLLAVAAAAFAPATPRSPRAVAPRAVADGAEPAAVERRGALAQIAGAVAAGAVAAGAAPREALARGRNTQAAMFQRYVKRIDSFADFLSNDIEKSINSADWAAVKSAAIAETEKKNGEIGPLFRGESALGLWAATFSEQSPSEKTKQMQKRVDVLTATRTELFATASKGDGTGLKNVGGFFGIGGAKEERPSDAVLKKSALASVAKAKAAFNEYVEISNAGRPLEIDPIKSLKVRGKPPPEPVVVAAAEE